MEDQGHSALSLYDLHQKIQGTFRDVFAEPVWVRAEINEITMHPSGHCYLELVEKQAEGEGLLARARGNIWAFTFRLLQPYFETTTGQPLKEGLKILVRVVPEFHELYGYSLNIIDIDPTYTMGDLARQKADTIRKLQEEGVWPMNRELVMPPVPQKIAIIASKSSAGYTDFMDQLHKNGYGYVFYTKLFPAIMQGAEAERSIIHALEQIFPYDNFFDVVVMIRGGGATSDLGCFDNYRLAYHVAQFSLPLITGIGHEKDETIVDMVAHTSLKTPTAVADFLIDRLAGFDARLQIIEKDFSGQVFSILTRQNSKLLLLGAKLPPLVQGRITREHQFLDRAGMLQTGRTHTCLAVNHERLTLASSSLKFLASSFLSGQYQRINEKIYLTDRQSKNRIAQTHHRMDMVTNTVRLLDPLGILKRGYSITYHQGNVIKDPRDTQPGEEITTLLFRGKLKSRVH
jgi:exodeoxyribonuclease VII large subunit